MAMIKTSRDTAESDVRLICDAMDARYREASNIDKRLLPLGLGAFFALMAVSRIVLGKDAELVSMFGGMLDVYGFVGLPVLGGWFIRDLLRRKTITRENSNGYRKLEEKGYSYLPGGDAVLYRVESAQSR